MEEKKKRGFQCLTPEQRREVSRKGGEASQKKGGHKWTAEEAKAAGRKGGGKSRGGRGRALSTSSD